MRRDIADVMWPVLEPWYLLYAVKGLREIESSLKRHAAFQAYLELTDHDVPQ